MRASNDADREFFETSFRAIAERMAELGLIRGNATRVETAEGRVFHFRCVRSYARAGSEAERQEADMLRRSYALAAKEKANGR